MVSTAQGRAPAPARPIGATWASVGAVRESSGADVGRVAAVRAAAVAPWVSHRQLPLRLRLVRQQVRPCPRGYACGASFDPLSPFHRHLELLGSGLGGPAALAAGTAFVVTPRPSPLAVGDGRGVVFISRSGDVCPSGFSPLVVGNVRQAPLSAIYAGSPLLRVLRDPRRLSGRCGRYELAQACGGSRAQANARSTSPLGEDPTCAYEPPHGRPSAGRAAPAGA
jgi:hypothetical protein